nr:AMP-binding protein [Candidatus Sigynarchaeota archaeon]
MNELGNINEILDAALRTPFYKEKYKDINIYESRLQDLPFLTQNEFRGDMERLLSVPMDEIAYVYSSSGTVTEPKLFYYSKKDLENITELCRRFAEVEGIKPGDRSMIFLPMRLWAVGAITMYGHARAGATVVPMDISGSRETWATLMQLLPPDVISSTPSTLQELISYGLTPKVKLIETTGEPVSRKTRDNIAKQFGSPVYDAYGLAECVVGSECEIHDGFHYWDDSVIVEIVDPETKELLPEGQDGEIVVTNLLNASMPVIRSCTGDIGHI